MINKTIIKFFLISVCFFSCSKNEFKIQTLEIQPILIDSTINIRALEIDNNKVFSASSTGSIFSFDAYNSKVISQLQYSFDSIVKPNFRALAVKNENVFANQFQIQKKINETNQGKGTAGYMISLDH